MGKMSAMSKWLEAYENRRVNKENRVPFESELWISSKYDFQSMDPVELQSLYLPEIGMCFGPACHKMKKLWRKFNIGGSSKSNIDELERRQTAYDILRVQAAMGVQRSHFDEYPELDSEFEEQEQDSELESEEDLNLSPGTGEIWSDEDKILLAEERAETDDWDRW